MAAKTLEQRISELEKTVERLVSQTQDQPSHSSDWKKLRGVYQNDPAFDEAERLGREWRDSFQPKDGEVAPL